MTVTRCASSFLLENLIAWRNPQGREANWLASGRAGIHSPPAVIESQRSHLAKVATAEIGFGILGTAALVETAFYTALIPVTLALSPIIKSPHQIRRDLLQSSSYTLFRSINFARFCRLQFNKNLMTHESFSRMASKCFVREPDAAHVYEWTLRNRPDWIERSEQQAKLLIEEILSGALDETTERIKNGDLEATSFILIEAIYLYSFGAKKTEAVPQFFSTQMQRDIFFFRNLKIIEDTQALNQLIKAPSQSNAEPPNETVSCLLGLLKINAEGESLRESILSNICKEFADELLADLGADVLASDVLSEATEETLEKLKNKDRNTILFVLIKCIALYAFGSKENAKVPRFFHKITRDNILKIRSARDPNQTAPNGLHFLSEDAIIELKRLTSSPDLLVSGPLNADVQIYHSLLGSLAQLSLFNSLLARSSLPKALEILDNRWVDPGATFLIQEVLAEATPDTLENFKDMDPDIISFILTKSIHTYVTGSKKEEKIPKFFKSATQTAIADLRLNFIQPSNITLLETLEKLMSAPENFDNEALKSAAQSAFNALREIASEEAQGSLFIRKCWPKAIEMMEAPQPITGSELV